MIAPWWLVLLYFTSIVMCVKWILFSVCIGVIAEKATRIFPHTLSSFTPSLDLDLDRLSRAPPMIVAALFLKQTEEAALEIFADEALVQEQKEKDTARGPVKAGDIFASIGGGEDESPEAMLIRRAVREAAEADEDAKKKKEHRQREQHLEVSRTLARIDRHMRAAGDGLRYCKNDPRMIRVKQGVL